MPTNTNNTMLNLEEIFEKHDDEFLRFDKIDGQKRLSHRPDIHAFILLDRLIPRNRDIVCAAEHDEIFLDIGVEELAKVATEDQIIELIRCGVRYSTEYDSLAMFV